MGPGGEGLCAAGPEVCGGVVVSAAGEYIGDLIMGGEEALNLPRRLEPLHDPLSSSGRLMGVFGPVIEALVLPMLDPTHDLPLGRGVALQLVGDEHTRCSTLLLEELAEQAFGGLLVAPALDQNIENEAVLVDGTPEPVLLSGDADDDLIEVPFVATARRSLTNEVGEFPAEFEPPLPETRLTAQPRSAFDSIADVWVISLSGLWPVIASSSSSCSGQPSNSMLQLRSTTPQ